VNARFFCFSRAGPVAPTRRPALNTTITTITATNTAAAAAAALGSTEAFSVNDRFL